MFGVLAFNADIHIKNADITILKRDICFKN